MIELKLKCPNCNREFRVEREYRSAGNHPVCGHGTILTPSKQPNLMQCPCGLYLREMHTAKENVVQL